MAGSLQESAGVRRAAVPLAILFGAGLLAADCRATRRPKAMCAERHTDPNGATAAVCRDESGAPVLCPDDWTRLPSCGVTPGPTLPPTMPPVLVTATYTPVAKTPTPATPTEFAPPGATPAEPPK